MDIERIRQMAREQHLADYNGTFDNEEDAYNYMCNINIRQNLEIKNHFTVFENHVLVQLTHGRVLKCGPEDLHIVEDYVWCVNGNGYVTTHIDGLNCSFHNIVMNHKPNRFYTVDHIDRDPLNCCKSNLHIVNKQTQSINCSMSKNNTSGTVGVYYNIHLKMPKN